MQSIQFIHSITEYAESVYSIITITVTNYIWSTQFKWKRDCVVIKTCNVGE